MVGNMFRTLTRWLRGKPTPAPVESKEPALAQAGDLAPASEENNAHPVAYDENLLERSRTQWQFGDWASLAKLERSTLQHHPDRAKLALLAAAGHQQLGDVQGASQFVRLAQDWGCSRKLVAQILIAGVHNTLGRAAASLGNEAKALKHFKKALGLGTPGSDTPLLVQARAKEQLRLLSGLPENFLAHSPSREKTRIRTSESICASEPSNLQLEDCRKLQRPPPEAELKIGSRIATAKEITYGENKFNFFFRRDSSGDNGAIKQIFEEKQYEFGWLPQGKSLYRLYEELIRYGKPPTIIDAGANIGTSCTWFLLKFPKASIIAIEPDSENCELLRNNSAGSSVHILQGGLADTRRVLFLNDPGQSDWGFRVEKTGAIEVECVGPSEVVNHCKSNDSPILIFKIDIEGAEAMAFQGDCQWLESIPMIIIELHDWMMPGKSTSANFLKAMASHDFELVTRGENIFCFNRQKIHF